MAIDEAVFDGLKRGDAAAFEMLVATFEGPLFRFFYCETRDRDLAEEFSAETFVRLVGAIPGMRGGRDRLRAFVYATARHVRSGHWRRSARRDVPLGAAAGVADAGSSPVESAERTEQTRDLMRAIDDLAPRVRSVVLLRFVEDLSIGEISDALGLPPGTVKSHLHRGKQRLRELLLKTGEKR